MRRSRRVRLQPEGALLLSLALAVAAPGVAALEVPGGLTEETPTADPLAFLDITETPLPSLPLPTSSAPQPTATPLPSPTLATPLPAPTASPTPTGSPSATTTATASPTQGTPTATARPAPAPAPGATAPKPSTTDAASTEKDPQRAGAWVDTDDDGILDTWDANATAAAQDPAWVSDPNATEAAGLGNSTNDQTADSPAGALAWALIAVLAAVVGRARQRPRS